MKAHLLSASLAVALGLSASAAFAQSYNAPAGIPAATAPGGLEGRAGGINARDAIEGRGLIIAPRGGDARDLTTGSVRRSGARNAW